MDAAGKDSAIEHVMSGVNPQGVQVFSFKQPSAEELDHDFLWRTSKALPERGRIGIFNRSHYEEVVALRVHPEWLEPQRLPPGDRDEHFWQQRYEDINAFERHLDRNGTKIVKFFLHVSKEEQKQRFIARLDTPARTGSSTRPTSTERAHWDAYMERLRGCAHRHVDPLGSVVRHPCRPQATDAGPRRSGARRALRSLDLRWPEVSAADHAANLEARKSSRPRPGESRVRVRALRPETRPHPWSPARAAAMLPSWPIAMRKATPEALKR